MAGIQDEFSEVLARLDDFATIKEMEAPDPGLVEDWQVQVQVTDR